jgi:hypothetical protein
MSAAHYIIAFQIKLQKKSNTNRVPGFIFFKVHTYVTAWATSEFHLDYRLYLLYNIYFDQSS